jgi:signal transduction histidine kinase
LEQIVEERTEEVRKAHLQLVKQEKLATMVKLTQGLIDRILNPLNYINNFTKLSEGLVRDVEATINDEKEHISKDNYEDTVEVLGMLRGNLQKVGEHGQNTSRTLKAMEEVLRDRTGGVVKTDVVALVRQIESTWQVTAAVKPVFDCPDTSLFVMANPELLSRVFISLLTNSVYAIKKRKEKLMAEDKASGYQPKLILRVTNDAQQTFVIISDNGNGIEQNILEKIFDPFFTTKTTGEASGIGLYLSYDIIQNYGGQITVESVKDDHTTFTITLPLAPKE